MIAVPRLHVVTDDLVLGRTDFLPVARALLEAGGDALALHVRGPRTDGRTIYELVHELVTREQSGGHVFVNDRVDVALTAWHTSRPAFTFRGGDSGAGRLNCLRRDLGARRKGSEGRQPRRRGLRLRGYTACDTES